MPDYFIPSTANLCRHCKKLISDLRLADGCPCNSGRGINHGLVPKACCTCKECDPEQTGASRIRDPEPAQSVVLEGYMTHLNTIGDLDGSERVTSVGLTGVPTAGGKAKQLRGLFGEMAGLPYKLRITIERIT